MCQPRKGREVTSDCSISTLATPDYSASEDGDEVRSLPKMRQVWSSGSVSTMSSEPPEEYVEGSAVEFDLTIEEGPKVRSWSDIQDNEETDTLWQPRPRKQQSKSVVAEQGRQEQRLASSQGSSPTSGPSTPLGPPPLGTTLDGGKDRLPQWRPLPKEYRHGHVPKNLNLQEEYRQTNQERPPTTLMIRNMPNRYTQRELMAELEDLGFAGAFDFLYVPVDKGTMSNVGYAFVNFTEHTGAEKCIAAFQNYRFKRHRKISGKIAAVSVAHIQGLEANLAHYENAAVNTAKLKQRRPVIMANISQTLGMDTGNDF